MLRQVLFADRQEVTPDDLINQSDWIKESDDTIVLDAVDAGRKFVGFEVTKVTQTSVLVAAGRLYLAGPRYFRADPGGYPLDLNGIRPPLQGRWVAVVISPDPKDTSLEERDVVTDVETGVRVPQQVNTERRQSVRIEAVPGAESVAPTKPVFEGVAVTVAYILMDTSGIVRIERNTDRVLDNLANVAGRTRGVEDWRAAAEPLLNGVQQQLGGLASQLANQASRKLLFDIASNVAILNKKLKLPANYVAYRGDDFTDATYTDKTAVGYAARVEEGLRLPYEAVNSTQLGLNNIYDPKMKVTGTGLLLPAYTTIEDRVVRGAAGEINLAQYSNEPRTFVKLAMSQGRARYGNDFEVSTGSAFYQTGTYLGRLNGGFRTIFAKDGIPYQQYDTGEVDPDGYKIVRLSKLWTDQVTEPYWSRYYTTEIVNGFAHCETFFNQHDRWIDGITPWIHGKPAQGNLTFGVCGTYRGEPDFDTVLSMTTLAPPQVKLTNAAGPDDPMTSVEPFFLKGGRFYTYFTSTPAAYIHAVADEVNPHSGTYFYGLNGGTWFAQPGVHLIFSLRQCVFGSTVVEAEMQPLSLAGGIQGLDILAEQIIPEGGDVVWSVFVDNAWKPFDEYSPNPLTAPYPQVARLKASFVGSNAVMPGIRLPGSTVLATRLALAGKHFTTPLTLPTPVNHVTKTVRLFPGWDPAHHTCTLSLKRGGVTETPDIITDVRQVDGSIERTAVFDLGAATSTYVAVIDFTTDNRLSAPVITETTEIPVT